VTVDETAKMSQEAVASNMNALMNYAKKLEVGIDEYNKFATEKNKAFGTEKEKP